MNRSAYQLFEKQGGGALIGCGLLNKSKMAEESLRYNFFTVVCVQNGTGRYFDACGNSYSLQAGSVFIRDIGKSHYVVIDSADWNELFVVFKSFSFTDNKKSKTLNGLNINCLMPNRDVPGITNETQTIIDTLCAVDRSNPVSSYPVIKGKIREFFDLIDRIQTGNNPAQLQCRVLSLMSDLTSWNRTTSLSLEEKVAELIRNTIYDNSPLPDILSTLHHSYASIRSRFQKYWNMSPGEYRIRYRIEQSLSLLQNPSVSIKEIAHRFGYNDQFAFSRQFKQYTGCNPS